MSSDTITTMSLVPLSEAESEVIGMLNRFREHGTPMEAVYICAIVKAKDGFTDIDSHYAGCDYAELSLVQGAVQRDMFDMMMKHSNFMLKLPRFDEMVDEDDD